MWQCKVKAIQKSPQGILGMFTAVILRNFSIGALLLSTSNSFFSLLCSLSCLPFQQKPSFSLLKPYANISCPVRLLAIQAEGWECYKFRYFQGFFFFGCCFFFFPFHTMIYLRNFDLTLKQTPLSLKNMDVQLWKIHVEHKQGSQF